MGPPELSSVKLFCNRPEYFRQSRLWIAAQRAEYRRQFSRCCSQLECRPAIVVPSVVPPSLIVTTVLA